jgi:phospholipid N-methyltransferase
MNSEQYRSICEQPNVFRLQDLNETIAVLRKENTPQVALIAKAILSQKIEKPPLHKGNHQTDFVALELSFDEVEVVVDTVFDAEACSIQENGEPTSKTEVYVHLVNLWSNYRESLE